MKKRFFGFVGILAATLLISAGVVSADDFKDALRAVPEEMNKHILEVRDSIFESHVGIGIEFKEIKEIVLIGENSQKNFDNKPTVGLVVKVLKNRPAEKSGVKANDIILAINGKPFNSGQEFIKEVLGDGKPGRKIQLDLTSLDLPLNYPRRVVEMNTVKFEINDIKKAAELLRDVLKEGETFINERKLIVNELLLKLDSDPKAVLSDDDIVLYNTHSGKFYKWLIAKQEEIEELKAPK